MAPVSSPLPFLADFCPSLSFGPHLWLGSSSWSLLSSCLNVPASFHLEALRCSHPHPGISPPKCCDSPLSAPHSLTPPGLLSVACSYEVLLLISKAFLPPLPSLSGSHLCPPAVPAPFLRCLRADEPLHALSQASPRIFAMILAESCLTASRGAALTSRHAGWHSIIVFLLSSICLFPSVSSCLTLRPSPLRDRDCPFYFCFCTARPFSVNRAKRHFNAQCSIK